jgi:hypothetical protein
MNSSFVGALCSGSIVCLLLAVLSPSALASTQELCPATNGVLDFTWEETGVVVGYAVGHGILTYETRQYPVDIRGGGILTFGHAVMKATACVENLERLRELAGTYWSVGGGASVDNGSFIADMENERGIDLHVRGHMKGPMISGQIARFSVRFGPGTIPDF